MGKKESRGREKFLLCISFSSRHLQIEWKPCRKFNQAAFPPKWNWVSDDSFSNFIQNSSIQSFQWIFWLQKQALFSFMFFWGWNLCQVIECVWLERGRIKNPFPNFGIGNFVISCEASIYLTSASSCQVVQGCRTKNNIKHNFVTN